MGLRIGLNNAYKIGFQGDANGEIRPKSGIVIK